MFSLTRDAAAFGAAYFLAWILFWGVTAPFSGTAEGYFDLMVAGLTLLHAMILFRLVAAPAPVLRGLVGLSLLVAVGPALAMLPLGSADAYFYAALGREWAVLGANPFTTPISSLQAGDAILRSPLIHHGHITSQYGPLGLLLFGLPWFAGASSLQAAVYGLKGLAVLALQGLAWLLARWFSGADPARFWWVLFALLNPFFISQLVLDVHKEVWILLPFLGGIWCLARRHGWLHGLCNAAVASISIYYVVYPLVLQFALLLSPQRARAYGGTLWRSWLIQGLVLVPAYAVWQGADLRGVLAASAQDHPGSGALMLLLRLAGHGAGWVLGVPGTTWSDGLKPISLGATALLLLGVVLWVRRRDGMQPRADVDFLLVAFGVSQALWLASWYYQPWYAVLGLAALAVACGLKGMDRAWVLVLGAGCTLGALHAWWHWAYMVALLGGAVWMWCRGAWFRRGAGTARQ